MASMMELMTTCRPDCGQGSQKRLELIQLSRADASNLPKNGQVQCPSSLTLKNFKVPEKEL